jgi:hypothetical protein
MRIFANELSPVAEYDNQISRLRVVVKVFIYEFKLFCKAKKLCFLMLSCNPTHQFKILSINNISRGMPSEKELRCVCEATIDLIKNRFRVPHVKHEVPVIAIFSVWVHPISFASITVPSARCIRPASESRRKVKVCAAPDLHVSSTDANAFRGIYKRIKLHVEPSICTAFPRVRGKVERITISLFDVDFFFVNYFVHIMINPFCEKMSFVCFFSSMKSYLGFLLLVLVVATDFAIPIIRITIARGQYITKQIMKAQNHTFASSSIISPPQGSPSRQPFCDRP